MIKEGTYYLRIFGYTTDGDVDTRDATMNLKKPVIGKHYYPHGVEYGEEEHFPKSLLKDCEATLKAVSEALQPYNLKKVIIMHLTGEHLCSSVFLLYLFHNSYR